jgi:hypothetical protein
MAWADLANNQAVTFNNLQNAVSTGVFLLRNTIPASNECITKADADFHVYINAFAINKSSNQLVVKQDLTSYTTGIIFTPISGLYPVSSGSASCSGTLINRNSYNVFIRGVFNSAGVNSGIVGNNVVYYRYPSQFTISLSFLNLSITSFGQNIFTNRDSESIRPGWMVLSPNFLVDITIDKLDGVGSGTTLRLAQSLSSVGTYTPF